MTRSKTTKRALVASVCATLMCIAMLIGTTFAWFTDTASTSVNKIQSGTLDVALEMNASTTTDPNWVSAEGKTLEFVKAADGSTQTVLWEPGCTYELPALRVVNNGNLALKYKILITGIKGDAKLNEAIEWTISDTSLDADHKLAAGATSEALTIKGHMKEEAGNDYQDLSIDGIAITVVATQDTVEYDSSSNNYDASAEYPVVAVTQVAVDTSSKQTTAEAKIESAQTVSTTDATPIATATIPSGVKTTASDGDTSIQLKLTIDEASVPANFSYDATSQEAKTLEVNMEGLATDNTAPITVTMYVGTNLSGFVLYHNNTAMTSVASAANVSNDQEYYYDSTTGIVTMKTATFSPFTYVCDRHDVKIVTTQDELNAAITNSEITTVKLGANWNGNILVNGAKNITLDFNGYTVSGTMYIGATRDHIINGRADASILTLMDSKGTGGVKTSENKAIWMMNSSNLTIESGTYESTGISNHNRTIYVADSTLTVNGGYFHNNAADNTFHWVIQCDNKLGPATLVINGGKFEGPSSDECGQDYLIKASEADKGYESGSVTINGGEFYSYTSNSYLAQGYSDVTVNNCTFVFKSTNKTWTNKVFSLENGYTLTVKGGTFTVNGQAYTDPSWNK